MRAGWLLRDGEVLASAQLADGFGERARGLSGHGDYEGALVLPGWCCTHSLGAHFALDVAFLDRDLAVLHMIRLSGWRVTAPRLSSRGVVEAPAGSFERWKLKVGDALEFREAR
jgi:uncharacterized membrane protein (UPF0127 family)